MAELAPKPKRSHKKKVVPPPMPALPEETYAPTNNIDVIEHHEPASIINISNDIDLSDIQSKPDIPPPPPEIPPPPEPVFVPQGEQAFIPQTFMPMPVEVKNPEDERKQKALFEKLLRYKSSFDVLRDYPVFPDDDLQTLEKKYINLFSHS